MALCTWCACRSRLADRSSMQSAQPELDRCLAHAEAASSAHSPTWPERSRPRAARRRIALTSSAAANVACRDRRAEDSAADPRSALSHPAGADLRDRVHGLSRPRHRRSLRQPADRGEARVLAARMAGRSDPLVSADSPRRQAALEHRSGADVLFGRAAAIGVSRARARRSCRLVPLRGQDGPARRSARPWFIQGVAFDITDLKQAEAALQDERNVLSAILDTVGALVVVLDAGRPHRRASIAPARKPPERASTRCGASRLGSVHDPRGDRRVQGAAGRARARAARRRTTKRCWLTPLGLRRIAWSSTILPRPDGAAEYIIATGIDITERRRLQKTILDISAQEQRRIGQDLHDGLGQHLTGIAFMSKVLEQKLAEQRDSGIGRRRQDRQAGQRGDRQDARTGARPAAAGVGRSGAGVGVEADRQRCRGSLPESRAAFECDAAGAVIDVHTATHLYHIVAKRSTTPSSTAMPAHR